jgi:hypothetical protein
VKEEKEMGEKEVEDELSVLKVSSFGHDDIYTLSPISHWNQTPFHTIHTSAISSLLLSPLQVLWT